MQIHGPSESIATIPVERYTSGTVVMRLPCKVVLLIESAADCDRLMIAAAQARELLTGGSLQDLAAAQASPANPYTALSAAAVAQDVEPCSCAFRHQLAEASIPAADIDKLSPPCPHHPTGHLQQDVDGWPAGDDVERDFAGRSPSCNAADSLDRICLRPDGHEGDHVAHGPLNGGVRWVCNRWAQEPTGHLPQHTGGEPGCTYGGCTDRAHDAGVTR